MPCVIYQYVFFFLIRYSLTYFLNQQRLWHCGIQATNCVLTWFFITFLSVPVMVVVNFAENAASASYIPPIIVGSEKSPEKIKKRSS
jgi:hypothetical protein